MIVQVGCSVKMNVTSGKTNYNGVKLNVTGRGDNNGDGYNDNGNWMQHNTLDHKR